MVRRINFRKTNIKAAVLLTIFLTILVSMTFTLNARAEKEGNKNYKQKYFTSVYIENGETLWHLAQCYADKDYYSNNYAYIKEIKKMNNLTSDNIKQGTYLLVTYYK